MENKFSTITLICVNTGREKIMKLIDCFTIKGDIVLLSCLNILEDSIKNMDTFWDMDKEKVRISDRLIVFGDASLTNEYVNALVKYGESLGKTVIFLAADDS